jgi:hypothetical protein
MRNKMSKLHATLLFTLIPTILLTLVASKEVLAEDLPWPGGDESTRIDITRFDMGNNMSGAVWNYETHKLWVVSNSGIFWRMSQSDPAIPDSWVVDTEGDHEAKWIVGGDTEAIAQADWNEETIFVGVEQPSRMIREYDVSGNLGDVSLQNTWILDEQMGSGDNFGLEALTFVPDEWLLSKNFVDKNGNLYTSSVYGTGGLFFAGLQANAHIYVFDLNRNSQNHNNAEYVFVGEYTTGQDEIAGLEFDRSNGILYSYHNYGNSSGGGSNDKLQALDITATGEGSIKSFPILVSWLGPRIHNNEGIALASNEDCDSSGNRNFFLSTDDGGNDNSVGIYPLFPCTHTICDIEMSQSAYTAGDTATAQVFRIANPGAENVPVEWKVWLRIPSIPPIPVINIGAGGSLVLPAGFDLDFGPIGLFPVTAGTPLGSYEFSCRMLDPVTGELLSEDLNPFTIQ